MSATFIGTPNITLVSPPVQFLSSLLPPVPVPVVPVGNASIWPLTATIAGEGQDGENIKPLSAITPSC